MILVDLLSYKFEYQKQMNIKLKRFSFEFLEYQDSDSSEKNNDFSIEYSSASGVVSIEILMEQSIFVVADN